MKRTVRCFVIGAALSLVAACAQSSADPVDSVAAPATDDSVAATTTAPGDFGSRYNGSPVAFWFWAPY